MDMRRMYYYRYGTEGDHDQIRMSYPQIAKLLYLPVSTVYQAIKRYENDGRTYVNRRRLNFQVCWARKQKIQGALKDYLLSYDVLSEWAPYSLEQRVKLIRKLGVNVASRTLGKFYKRHLVSYRVVKYRFAGAQAAPLADTQRFVVDLARRIQRKELVVYFDETSCNMWHRKRMSWSTRNQPVKMHLNRDRGHGVTVLGAIGERLP